MARVLVVTDDPSLRWDLSKAVTSAGHEVVQRDGDVALLDLDGYGAGGGAFATWPDEVAGLPVVGVTAAATSEIVEQALALGVADVLLAPVRGVEVDARVRSALRAAGLEASLREVMRTDALTGLANRRHLDEHLAMTASAARRHRQPISLLLVDVDHLRRVNDAAGHAAGDAVLREVAARVLGRLRTEDMAGRWGGEEFLVLLPATALDGAWHLAERVREAVASSPVAIGGGRDVLVTVSVGCAEGTGDDVDDHLRRTSDALDAAKAAGRNKVVIDTSVVA